MKGLNNTDLQEKIAELKSYGKEVQKITALKERLCELKETLLTMSVPRSDGVNVKGSANSERTEAILDKLNEMYSEISFGILEAECQKQKIIKKLSSLPEREQIVLKKFYVNLKRLDDIAEDMCLSSRHVARIKAAGELLYSQIPI